MDSDEDTVCPVCNNQRNSRFWISCSKCEVRFHGVCVKMSKRKADKVSDWFCTKCHGPPTSSFETVCICQNKDNNNHASLNLRVVGECGQCHKYFHMHCIRVIEFNGTMSCPRCCNQNSTCINDIVLQVVVTKLAPQSTMNSEENGPLTSQSPMKVIDNHQADDLNCMTSEKAVSIGDGITMRRKEHDAAENTDAISIEENYKGLEANGTSPPKSMKHIEKIPSSMDCGSPWDDATLSQSIFKPKKAMRPPSKLTLAYRKTLTQ